MRTEIVAEIGVNAGGSVDEACALVKLAQQAGADVVKFQATYPRVEMSSYYLKDRIEMTERVILTHAQLEQVAAFCKAEGIEFLCTPSEMQSLHWMIHSVAPKRIKIGSDNITNIPLLELAASYGLPIILSTGMASMDEVDVAYATLRMGLYANEVTLLHCTTSYPCDESDANLACIGAMRSAFPHTAIGWSDHTRSVRLPSVAVALGATMIEKHFTRNREQDGPDHASSLDPVDFANMVWAIWGVEAAMGSGVKETRQCEEENKRLLRASVVAACSIEKGEKYDKHNIAIKRPGTGMTPATYNMLLGRKALRSYVEGELITTC